jgi:hypothetical protein
MAGTDEYLGTMTIIGTGDTRIAGAAGAAAGDVNIKGTGSGVTQGVPTWYSTTTAAKHNDNDDTADVFDIGSVTSNAWLIGSAKLNAKLSFGSTAAIDWLDA